MTEYCVESIWSDYINFFNKSEKEREGCEKNCLIFIFHVGNFGTICKTLDQPFPLSCKLILLS